MKSRDGVKSLLLQVRPDLGTAGQNPGPGEPGDQAEGDVYSSWSVRCSGGKVPEICACQMVVTREKHQDKMLFRTDLTEICALPLALAERIARAMQDILRVRGKVELLPSGAIPKGAKKFEDSRTWD